jgi:Leucine Rich repeat
MKFPRIRTSVRTLMTLVLVFGGGLGWVVHRAHVQRDAIAAVEKTGGRVRYDWGVLANGDLNQNGPPKWRRWLCDRIGVDYLADVVEVHLGKQATDVEMSAVAQFERLRIFDNGNSRVTDTGLAALRESIRLENFTLKGNSGVSGASLAHLRGLPSLRLVQLLGVRLADPDFANLEKLTSLESLDLSSATGITDVGLARIGGLTGLKRLVLSRTKVTDSGLAHIRGLTTLSYLTLMGTGVTDGGLPAIAGLPALTFLDLAQTKVTDAGLPTLGSLKNLTRLRVKQTGVTDVGVSALQVANPKVGVSY